jgi:hypothetical protein
VEFWLAQKIVTRTTLPKSLQKFLIFGIVIEIKQLQAPESFRETA